MMACELTQATLDFSGSFLLLRQWVFLNSRPLFVRSGNAWNHEPCR
jgi:hypothetical protein